MQIKKMSKQKVTTHVYNVWRSNSFMWKVVLSSSHLIESADQN